MKVTLIILVIALWILWNKFFNLRKRSDNFFSIGIDIIAKFLVSVIVVLIAILLIVVFIHN